MRAIAAILDGYHPGFFPAYILPRAEGEEPEARHNREYTPREMARLLVDSGFEVTLLETGPFREEPKPEHEWVKHLLARYELLAGTARRRNLRGRPKARAGARSLSGVVVSMSAAEYRELKVQTDGLDAARACGA